MYRRILKEFHGRDVVESIEECIRRGDFDHYYGLHVAHHYVGHKGQGYIRYGTLDTELYHTHKPVVTFGRGFNVYWTSHIMVDWEPGGLYHTLRTYLDVNQFPEYLTKTTEYENLRGGIIRGPFDHLDRVPTTIA